MPKLFLNAILTMLVITASMVANAGSVQAIHSAKFPELQKQALHTKPAMERMANQIHKDLSIVFKECGQINAFYSPRFKTVTICYEYLDNARTYIHQQFKGESVENLSSLVTGTMAGVLFHELGHALVDLYDFPLLGGEEDAVDRYATVMILDITNKNPLMGMLYLLGDIDYQWGTRPKSGYFDRLLGTDKNLYHDEHPLSEQRVFNKVCLAYGYNAKVFAGLAKRFNLPESRALRCKSEYQAAESAVVALLSKISKREVVAKGETPTVSADATWHGQLGTLIQDVPEYLAGKLGLVHALGALVMEIEPASNASRAGLQPKDVIQALNGRPINTARDLPGQLIRLPISTDLTLSVWRSGRPLEILVTATPAKPAIPESMPMPAIGINHGVLGLEVLSLPADQKKLLQIDSGVFVSKASGPAAKAGIVEGDLIVAVRTSPINSQADLDREIAGLQSKSVNLLVKSGAQSKFVTVVLD